MGYTLTDAAYAARISTETIRRWRNRYPEFNSQIIEAANQQWENPASLAKYHNPKYHGYRRPKIARSSHAEEKTTNEPSLTQRTSIWGSIHATMQSACGLPIRDHCILDDLRECGHLVETPKYYNTESGMVEWISKYQRNGRLVFGRCELEVYRRKNEE